MAVTHGRAVIYGIRPIKPIVNLPTDANKVRVRMRPCDAVKAYVRYADHIEEWVIQPTGGVLGADTWELGVLIGVNGKAWSAINAVLDAGGQFAGCSADATKAGSS